jgi:hypothetical protein
MYSEAVMGYFKVLSPHSLGGTEETSVRIVSISAELTLSLEKMFKACNLHTQEGMRLYLK